MEKYKNKRGLSNPSSKQKQKWNDLNDIPGPFAYSRRFDTYVFERTPTFPSWEYSWSLQVQTFSRFQSFHFFGCTVPPTGSYFSQSSCIFMSLAYSRSLQIWTMIRTRPNRPIKTKLNILVNTCPQIMCTKVGEILSTGFSDTHLLHLWCPLWVGFKMY